jgi:hypothetical protein
MMRMTAWVEKSKRDEVSRKFVLQHGGSNSAEKIVNLIIIRPLVTLAKELQCSYEKTVKIYKGSVA